MAGKKRGELPPTLARVRERFRVWRKMRRPGDRIPGPLWTSAVKLARAHGICRTASVLGVDYYSLKKRLEAASGGQLATNPAFIELPTPVALSKQCTIELDDGCGATLRVSLAGYDAADVATLAHRVWSSD